MAVAVAVAVVVVVVVVVVVSLQAINPIPCTLNECVQLFQSLDLTERKKIAGQAGPTARLQVLVVLPSY